MKILLMKQTASHDILLFHLQAITKFASVGNNADSIDLVRGKSKSFDGHSVGIAHTRWATHGEAFAILLYILHTVPMVFFVPIFLYLMPCLLFLIHLCIGGKTDENAHPHVDSSGKIALVHNGTINNANELRKKLIEKGHKFTSQTDTEVVAKLIGDVYASNPEYTLRGAVEDAMAFCQGTWVSRGYCSALTKNYMEK